MLILSICSVPRKLVQSCWARNSIVDRDKARLCTVQFQPQWGWYLRLVHSTGHNQPIPCVRFAYEPYLYFWEIHMQSSVNFCVISWEEA